MAKIRVWKLGSLEHHIAPSEAAVDKLANILESADENGITDIVWGPDIDCMVVDGDTDIIVDMGYCVGLLNSAGFMVVDRKTGEEYKYKAKPK